MAVKVSGGGGGVGDLSGWQHGAQQVRGFFDSILRANPGYNNGLRQMQQINPQTAHGAEQLGSFFTGTPERALVKPTGWGSQAPLSKPVVRPPITPTAAQGDPQQQIDSNNPAAGGTDLLGFLGQAMDILRQNGGLAGSNGPNYDALKSQLQGQYGQNDARLNAMYGQLQKSYAADAPAIAQGYDQAIGSVGQTAQDATAATNAGYQAARDAQSQQLQALGIQDAAAVLASQGGRAAQDQAFHDAQIQHSSAAVQNQLQTNKAAAGNYNTNIEHAAGLEGAMQRAGLQQQLASALAKLNTQQAADSANNGQQNFNSALSLAGQLYSDQNSKTQQETALKAAQAAAQQNQLKFQYQQYQDQQNNALKSQSALATLYPALLKQYGGDDAKATKAAKALGLL